MCGIVGLVNLDGSNVDESLLIRLNNRLEHRGPDHGDIFVNYNFGIGHRRLSIIDLSSSANQPMHSSDSRYSIVFNGEIYNFLELRAELITEGYVFTTNSDTEVVLKSFLNWGISCFDKFNGMFALAIFDKDEKSMVLARDQFGIKPLYYYKSEKYFLFASEMKSILIHPEVKLSLNNQALIEYFWYGNPLGNNTIYNEVTELTPGSYLRVTNTEFVEKKFFSVFSISEIDISEKEAISNIEKLFEKSIKRHLISDVPVGVFLSGGIDSSAITAIASKNYSGKLNTYSVEFDFANGINELSKAKLVAEKFNTNHHEIMITGADAMNCIEDLVDCHDEPFGDAADIPLYLLSKKIKNEVKVVLQGDGGDEFFGGYSRYNTVSNLKKWSKYRFLKSGFKYFRFNNQRALQIQRFILAITEKNEAKRNALLLTSESELTNPINIFNPAYLTNLSGTNPFNRYHEFYKEWDKKIKKNPVQSLFYSDTQIILKDTFFEKVDKSTMANSLEVRIPFLDKELTEFMLSIPASLKVKNGVQKYLLKKVFEGTIPNEILYGPKTGFTVPYDYWLTNALSDSFFEQISTTKVKEILNYNELVRNFDLLKKGKGNYGFLLWKAYIFAIWYNKNTHIVG